jgi:hypothetical protein
MKIVNATFGYRFDTGYRLQIDIFQPLQFEDHPIDDFQVGSARRGGAGEPPKGAHGCVLQAGRALGRSANVRWHFLMRARRK